MLWLKVQSHKLKENSNKWSLACFKSILKNSHSKYVSFSSNLHVKFAIFLKSSLLFNCFYCLFLFTNKTLRLNNLKTRTPMNVKIPVFVICVEAIIYLLLYNLHDCTFKFCICHKLKTIVPASAKIFITTLAVILTLNKEILKNISQEQQIVHNIAKTLNKCLRICQRILNFFQFHN